MTVDVLLIMIFDEIDFCERERQQTQVESCQ